MVETKFITERLKQMIKKYADNPDRFFSKGQSNDAELGKLIEKHISIDKNVRSGKACAAPRIAVCDIVGDTCDLGPPKKYILTKAYGPILPPEAIDAAYAFLMRFPDKVDQDFKDNDFYETGLPKELYT